MLRKTIGQAFALGALALLATGCTVTATTDPAPVTTTWQTESAKLTAALEGIWTTGCYGSNGLSLRQTVVFRSGSFNSTKEVFMNSGCPGAPIDRTTSQGTFNLGQPSWSLNGAYDLDLTITSGTDTPGVYYTILMVENESLYLSNARTTSPNARPAEVDKQRPYKKVGG